MTIYINPRIITWARECNGLTIEELAASMKGNPDELRMWESGGKTPSYTSLEELAYRHFHIPLAIFFFPEPPDIDDVVDKFRRLPAIGCNSDNRIGSDLLAVPMYCNIQLPLLRAIEDADGELRIQEALLRVEVFFPELAEQDKRRRLPSVILGYFQWE